MKPLEKLIEKIKTNLERTSTLFKLDARNNWFLMFFIFVVVSIIILVSLGIEFYKIGSDEATLIRETDLRSETLNRGLFDDVLFNFRQKRENYNLLKTSSPRFVDPS